MTDVAGVVLCGGGSRRMGRDKAFIEVDGQPLVLRGARRVEEVCHPVFLAPGRLPLEGLGYPTVPDAAIDTGPLGGLLGALHASPHPWMAAVAVDMPFASPGVLRLLVDLAGEDDAVVPVTTNGPEPLHALYQRSCLPPAERALFDGRYGLRSLLDELSVRFVGEEEWHEADPEGRFALNVNSVEDLEPLSRAEPRRTGDP
jgi:molybdopterin-guanine dinucleotide biosynthesis protein A